MRCFVVLLLALCACEARVSPPTGLGPDSGTPPGDGPGAGTDTGGDGPAACSNGRVVFLQFEGQALTDAATSNAKQNQASWMTIANGTAPPYHQGSGTRAADIQAIVDGITQQLSSFPITVVTTRPTTGDYVMIVYGGQASNVGSRFSGAVQELDCGDANRNDVAWVSDGVSPTQRIVNFSVGAIGFGLGLTATSDPNDCMCGWDNACQSDNSAACNLTENITRDPNANQLCAGAGATQSETTAFDIAFCQ